MKEMKKNFRKITSLVVTLAVMVTAVVFDMPAKTVARAETTGGCDGTHSGMSAWTDENDLPTSDNYYLDTDVNLSSCSYISTGSLTLCLNGHTITAASGKQIFSISDSLTLCDCSSGKTGKLIGGGNVSFSGGAVDVTGSGTFTMNGGTISGNTAATGGGVYVRSSASFIMNGGTISNNITKSNGGGVYCSGIFTMNGGTISDNTTNSNAGGGVFVAGSGTFIMKGGMISSNTADIRGGGVYVNDGTFTMSGGIISGNTTADKGGGVCINGTFEINGNVNISGNTKTDGSDNNVYLFTGKKISIGNDFNASSTIGVNTEAELANCKSYADVTGATTEEISASFTADINGQSIVYEDGKVQLIVAHTVTKTAAKVASCTEAGNIEYWYCSSCEKYFSDEDCTTEITQADTVITKLEHSFSTAWSTDGTNHWHVCTRTDCTTVSDKAEHTFTQNKDTSDHWQECSCDYTKDKTAHEWGNWTVKTPATEESKGEKQRECSVCHATEEREIPVLTHTHALTHVPEAPATETTEGVKEHWHCAGCGKDFADENGTNELTDLTIPTLGHTHALTRVPEVPATETTEGTKEHWHCAGCGKDFDDENGTTELTDLAIPPLSHTHTLTRVPEVPATETTEGIKEHWHCAGCNKDFADENGEKEITSDELKIGRIEKEVQSGENAPTAELTTPQEELIDAVLTSEEQAVVNDGKDVKIVLTVEDATESVSSEDKTAVESKIESLTNYHLGQYLDVNLLKIIDGETEKIAETSAPITITFEIPAALRVSGRSYSVIRVHDGETTVLPDLDSDENTVTIQTDKFSTYALAYLENASASDPSGGNPGGNPSTPAIPTPGGNHSGTTPSGNGSSTTSGNSSNNGNSGLANGNGNSTANESGNDSSNDRNENDPSDIEEDPSDVEDDSSDVEDDDESTDVEDDFSDDDNDSTDVEEDSTAEEGNSESGNSDQAVNASSEDTGFSVDGTGHGSDESDSNPSTGVAVSLVPLAAAVAVLMAAAKRKKK